MLSKYKIHLLFLPILLLTISCQSDLEKCEEAQHMGDFFLLEDSKSFMPYELHHSKVIFSDSIGNEYEGKITSNSTFSGITLSSVSEICPFNDGLILEHKFNAERKVVKIIFQELGIGFSCIIGVNVKTEYNNSKETSDGLSILLQDNNDSNILSTLSVNIANRNGFASSLSHSIFHDVFEIHGKEYKDVYSHNNGFYVQDNYSIFYSESEGVLGVKSLKNSDFSYKFERIE